MTFTPGDVPPNIFVGAATIDGEPVQDGTNVTGCLDGEPVGTAQVTDGQFKLAIQQRSPSLAGEEITFSIGGIDANETAIWAMGGVVLNNLSAER